MLLYNNIIVAMEYLKTMIILKNFRKKETFNQTIRLVFEKLPQKWGSKDCTGALTDEIKTLKLTASTLRIYVVIAYSRFQLTSYGLNQSRSQDFAKGRGAFF